MEEVKRAFTVLENHSVIQRLEGKFNQGSCRIAILPTILSAVSSEKLNLVVSVLKRRKQMKKLKKILLINWLYLVRN